jgi:glycosyltransferase involved in cell wall biosynthesis
MQYSNKFNGLKIIGFRADESACGYLRIQYPLEYAQRHGAMTKIINEVSMAEIEPYDYVLAQRQYRPEVLDMMDALREKGKTVIYEVDDYLHGVHADSPAFPVYKKGTKELANAERGLSSCHGITVTTHELAAFYLALNKNTYVISNCVDFDIRDWETKVENRDKSLTVGWSGGNTHQKDINLLWPIVLNILRKYDHIKFAIQSSPEMVQRFCLNPEIEKFKDRIIILPAVGLDNYPKMLTHFDIGLAPIACTAFNMAKSSLKYLEHLAHGIPIVGSKVAPYARFARECPAGAYVATNTYEWEQQLSRLIEDETYRKEQGQAGQEYVRTNYDYKTSVDKWVRAWEDIRFKGSMGDLGPGPELDLNVKRNDPCPCGSNKKYKKCCYPAYGQ